MARSSEQREVAENSPEAKQCERDENRGQMYTPSCLRARMQATTINKYVIKLKAHQASNDNDSKDSIIKLHRFNFFPA
jgi:hypothetical protein